MIYKKLLLVILLTIFAISTYAQTGYKELNAKSLNAYNTAKWDSVLYYGKLAKKENIDYYYLSYRLAVANFYLGKYFVSTYYFNKAVKQNENAMQDLFFIDLYYRALLYSKQYAYAENIFTANDSIDKIIGIKHRGSFYASYVNNNTLGTFDIEELRMDKYESISENHYQQSSNTMGIGGHFIASGKLELSFRYAYSQIGMISALENQVFFNIRNYNANQNVINIKPRIHFSSKSSIDVAFGFHYVNGSPYTFVDTTAEMDFVDFSRKSIMAGLGYNYLYKNFRLGANAIFSNFGDTKNYQFGASLQWFPKGNFNIYSITEISALKANDQGMRPILYQKIGGKIANRTWLETYVILGDVQNYTMFGNNYTFETAYKTKALMGAKLLYFNSAKLSFFVGPQIVSSYNEKVTNEEIKNGKGNRLNYYQLNIMGGLQWKY